MPQGCQNVGREVIMDTKQRKTDTVAETQARPPTWNPIPSDWSNEDDDENDKDDQARAPIAKPIPQDPQPSTSFGTYPSATLLRVVTFGQGKIAPLASGTITIGCRCGTATTKEAGIACATPSPHRIVHNNSIQIYEEPPAPGRCRHSLANWTSVRLGNDLNHQTVDETTKGPQYYNLITDPADQQDREINNNQSTDPEIRYSDYSTDHLEDLE